MSPLSVVALLCMVSATMAASPAECGFTTSRACVASNDLLHPLPNLLHMRCVWCQSSNGAGPSHCTAFEEVRMNPMYHTNWVCDFADMSPAPIMHVAPQPVGDSESGDPYDNGNFKPSMPTKPTKPTKPVNGMTGMNSNEGPFQKLIDNLKKKAPKPLQFLGGLAMGALGHLAGIDPSKIVMGVDNVTGDLQNLFKNFKLTPNGLKDTVSNVANTIRDMSSVLNAAGLHDLANKASKVADVANKVEGWVVKANQLVYKGVNIYSDLKQALSDFKSGNLYGVGTDIGNIIGILHPPTAPNTALPSPPVDAPTGSIGPVGPVGPVGPSSPPSNTNTLVGRSNTRIGGNTGSWAPSPRTGATGVRATGARTGAAHTGAARTAGSRTGRTGNTKTGSTAGSH